MYNNRRHYCSQYSSALGELSSCISDLAALFSLLQLNPTKSELIWLGCHVSLAKIPSDLWSLPICGMAIDCTDVVCDLKVWLDSELMMKHHISKIASVCFYHLHWLWQLRDKISQKIMRQLVMSLVLSRIDYCNVVLAGLPASTIASLQHVQNAAARLVLLLDRQSHITPDLHKLHWLPVSTASSSKCGVHAPSHCSKLSIIRCRPCRLSHVGHTAEISSLGINWCSHHSTNTY